MVTKNFLYNYPTLIFRIIQQNGRNIFVTLVGLIFIASIMTATLTTDSTFKENYVDQQIKSRGNITFSFTKSGASSYGYGLFTPSEKASTRSLILQFLNSARSWDLENYLSYQDLIGLSISRNVKVIDPQTNKPFFPNPGFEMVNRSLLNSLSTLSLFQGRLPEKPNEVIYFEPARERVYPDNFSNFIQLGGQINASFPLGSRGEFNQSITVVGIYTPILDLNTIPYYLKSLDISDKFLANNPVINDGSFLTDFDLFQQLMGNKTNDIALNLSLQFGLSLNNGINYLNLNSVLSNVHQFSDYIIVNTGLTGSINRYIPLNQFSVNTLYEPLYSLDLVEFNSLGSELGIINAISFIAMIPAIIIAVIFTYYASNLFFKNHQEQLKLLRLRGTKKIHLFLELVTETFFSGLLALIIGIPLGILIIGSFGVFDPTYYFSYTSAIHNLSVGSIKTISGYIYVFVIFITLGQIYSIAHVNVENNDSQNSSSLSVWQKYYLDVILLTVGLVGSLFYYLFVFTNNFTHQLGPVNEFTFILTYIFIPFPIFLLIGGLTTIIRIFPTIIEFLGQHLWNRSGSLFSYTMINLLRQKQVVMRTLLLFSIIFSFSIFMVSLEPVIQTNISDQAHFSVGADAFYDHTWNIVTNDILLHDSNISSFTPMGLGNLFVKGQFGSNISLNVFIISPGFFQTAFFKSNFGNEHALNQLFSNNLSVAVSTSFTKFFRQSIGSNIPVWANQTLNTNQNVSTQQLSLSNSTINLKISSTFSYWPRFMSENDVNRSLDIVMTNNTLTTLFTYDAKVIITQEAYYLKLTPKANFLKMRQFYGSNSLTFAKDLIQNSNDLLLNEILHLHLIMLTLFSILTIFFMTFLTGYYQLVGRIKEISIERALGLKIRQLGRQMFYESALVATFSLIIGSIVGLAFTYEFLSVWLLFINPNPLFPSTIYFPIKSILLVTGSVFIIAILSSILPAIFARKKNLKVSLRSI